MTPAEIRVPELEGATEVLLGSVLIRPGQRVEAGQPVAEVQTDKVNAEVESPLSGTVAEVLLEEGATVKPGDVIARLEPA